MGENKSGHKKSWYRKWWGIVLIVPIWPYFLLWYIWARTKLPTLAKVLLTIVMAFIILVTAVVALIVLVSLLTGNSGSSDQYMKDYENSKPDSSQQSTTPAPATPTTPAPTTSMDTLNAGAVAAFTPELTDLSNQMAQGQSLVNQPDAITIGGPFNNWSQSEQHDQNVKNNENVTTAYNTADNAYYNAHQTAPDAINNWDTDAGNVVSDITKWADAQQTVFADKVGGDPAQSSDQQTADNDYQQYQTDMAKAQADMKQL